MMRIEQYLKRVRATLLRKQLLKFFLWAIMLVSIALFVMIQLESIFYFHPKIKILFILGLLGCVFVLTISETVYLWRAKKNNIYQYKIDNIAKNLGSKIYKGKGDLVLNALQLEMGSRDTESVALADSYIKGINEKLKSINLKEHYNDNKVNKLKLILLSSWMVILVVFFLKYETSANSFFRLANSDKVFFAPKPFTLLSMSGDIHIIGGDSVDIYIQAYPSAPDTLALNLVPSQVSTQKRDSLALNFFATPIEDGVFHFKIPELYQDYSYQAIVRAKYFWEAWKTVTTEPEMIYVTDRPSFEKFSLTTIPPKYSKLKKETQEGNVAMVEGLKGSTIQIDLTSNRMLKSSYMNINDERLKMSSRYNIASGYFKLMEEGQFTVNIVDKRGITNKDPIPYKINTIPDYDPNISIIKPPPVIELGNDQTIPIHLEVSDDFGFTNLQLAYEIQRPAYLKADPYVAMFNINELNLDSLNQQIIKYWDLTDLMLMPDDEVHFHFELTDNDDVSGPKKTISNTFIARVPSLADLYEDIEESENNIIEDIITELDDIEDLKEAIRDTELKMLKSNEIDWDEKQSLKNSIDESKKEIEKLEKLSDALEAITEQAEKHKLLSPSMLEKFKELSELVNDIMPKEMMNNINDLEMALENLDMDSIQDALNQLSEDMAKIEEDLDRYLEIFKRFKAEQKLDEIQTRMQKLNEQQNALNNEITQSDKNSESMGKLAQEEQRNLDEFENLLSLLEDASELIEPFNQISSNELSNLSQSDLSEEIGDNLNDAIQSLSSQNRDQAMSHSKEASMNMNMMMQQMMDIKQSFSQQSISEMLEKFQDLLQNMLYLSSQEEQLRNDTKLASRNSPRLREFAQRQQILQDQLGSITRKMLDLSNETFAITPDIGRGIGKANSNMEEAKSNLTDRNLNQAEKNHDHAMEGLNEAALALFNSMQNMQKSGSASGFQQFLEMMQQMSGQQQGINQKGMQLSLGQMAAAAQQQMMQQMLNEQKGIRKSLEQLMKEMQQTGQNSMGDLSGIKNEMDDVIKDLQDKRYNRKTQERQQRILSRMLDSQTSMTQRGKKDERKSTSAKGDLVFLGPGGLPIDLGQRENLAIQALNKSMKAGYSKDNQMMIKRYFNSLSQIPSGKAEEENEEK